MWQDRGCNRICYTLRVRPVWGALSLFQRSCLAWGVLFHPYYGTILCNGRDLVALVMGEHWTFIRAGCNGFCYAIVVEIREG